MKPYHDSIIPPIAMLANDYHPHLVNYPCAVQVKLDGIRAFVSPEGKVYYGRSGSPIPTLHNQFGKPGVWLDGEIYKPNTKLQYIAGLCRLHNATNATRSLEFHAFDVIGSAPQYERLLKLGMFGHLPNVTIVHTTFSHNPWAVTKKYNDLPPEAEGIVYRDMEAPYMEGRSNFLLKRKRMKSAEYKCVGVTPGMGKFNGTLGAFVCVLADDKTEFNVSGAELTNKERDIMWANPPFGEMLTVRFPSLSDKGIPQQAQFVAVRKEWE